jgi:glutathione S-transferase
MAKAVLTISSKNYSSWCLRGWLMCRMAGLDFVEEVVPADDPAARAELLLLSPSFLVPSLRHNGLHIWDTLAIGEYLHELHPEKHLLPKDRESRAHCRSVSGEMHSGFANLRSALPMNLKAQHKNFKIWGAAKADIARVIAIWDDCVERYGGPYLFGEKPSMADAMYAPVCTRFETYDVKLDRIGKDYCETILSMADMIEWTEAAKAEPEALEDLEAEF